MMLYFLKSIQISLHIWAVLSKAIWAASRKKGPWGNFDQNVYFSISLMCIILRLICEILSGIAVEIRFLWDS